MTQERSDYDGQVRNVNDLLQVCQTSSRSVYNPQLGCKVLITTGSECCPTAVPLYLL
jgi:hypothetical protein